MDAETRTGTVLDLVLEILREVTEDLDTAPVTPGLPLGSLGLESISLVYLIAEVQQAFGLGDGLLRALRTDPPVDVRALTIEEFAGLAQGVQPGVQAGVQAGGGGTW